MCLTSTNVIMAPPPSSTIAPAVGSTDKSSKHEAKDNTTKKNNSKNNGVAVVVNDRLANVTWRYYGCGAVAWIASLIAIHRVTDCLQQQQQQQQDSFWNGNVWEFSNRIAACAVQKHNVMLDQMELAIIVLVSVAATIVGATRHVILPKYFFNNTSNNNNNNNNNKDGAATVPYFSRARTTQLVLLLHILSGIPAMIGSISKLWSDGTGGFTVPSNSSGSSGIAFWIMMMFDMIHQVTLLGMLVNQEGRVAVKVDNVMMLMAKLMTLSNYYYYYCYTPTPTGQVAAAAAALNGLFLANFGFLGTRLLSMLSAVHMLAGRGRYNKETGHDSLLEHNYSLGLGLTALCITSRVSVGPQYAWMVVVPVVSFLLIQELLYHRHQQQDQRMLLFSVVTGMSSYWMLAHGSKSSIHLVYIAFYHLWTLTPPTTTNCCRVSSLSMTEPAAAAAVPRFSFSSTSGGTAGVTEASSCSLTDEQRQRLRIRAARAWAASDLYRNMFLKQ